MLGDPKGHDVMAEAVEQVRPAAEAGAEAPPKPAGAVQVLLEYCILAPPGEYRGRLDPGRARDLALRWFPDSPPLLWALADRYFREGQPRAAVVLLERLIRLGADGGYDHRRGFDPRIIGPWALLNLGQCRRALGEPAEARRCFEQLLQDPEHAEQAAGCLAEIDGPTAGAG